MEFKCDICSKVYSRKDSLARHKRIVHDGNAILTKSHAFTKKNVNSEKEYAESESKKEAQDIGRSVILSTTSAFVRVHDAVKSAFEEIREEIFLLYATDGNQEATNERIEKYLQPYSNFVNDGLQRDAFLVCDVLIKDIVNL